MLWFGRDDSRGVGDTSVGGRWVESLEGKTSHRERKKEREREERQWEW